MIKTVDPRAPETGFSPRIAPLTPGMSDLPIGHLCRPSGPPDIKGPGPNPRTPKLMSCTSSILLQTGPSQARWPSASWLQTRPPGDPLVLLGPLETVTAHPCSLSCNQEPPDRTVHTSVPGSPAWEELGRFQQISGESSLAPLGQQLGRGFRGSQTPSLLPKAPPQEARRGSHGAVNSPALPWLWLLAGPLTSVRGSRGSSWSSPQALQPPLPSASAQAGPAARGPSSPLTWVKSHSRCAGRATSSHFLRAGVRPLPSSTRHLESGRKAVEPRGPSCSRPSALYRTSWGEA